MTQSQVYLKVTKNGIVLAEELTLMSTHTTDPVAVNRNFVAVEFTRSRFLFISYFSHS